jgi:hypothetical protein
MTSTGRIGIGNAENFPATRGWFVGGFLPDEAGLRRTDQVEVKWSSHPAGDRRMGVAGPGGNSTLTVLISGRFELIYPGDTPERTVLARQGDYVVFGPDVPHTWRALADSVTLTVRWKASTPSTQPSLQ